MDQVLRFYEFMSFPIYDLNKSSRQRQKIGLVWCVITLIWYDYHYGHTWLMRRVSYLLNSQNLHKQPTSLTIAKIFDSIFEISWPTVVKLYLIVMNLSASHPINRSVSDLNESFDAFKSGLHIDLPTIRWRLAINALLGVTLFLGCLSAYLTADFINTCRSSADQCGMLYIIPVMDHIGELITMLLLIMSISLLPVVLGVACLQFSRNIQAFSAQLASSPGVQLDARCASLIDKLVTAQSKFIENLEGWLCALVSLSAVTIILSVALIALKVTAASIVSLLWIVIHFGYISFLCYASSKAGEAVSLLMFDYCLQLNDKQYKIKKSKLLDQLRRNGFQTSLRADRGHYFLNDRYVIDSLVSNHMIYTL